jgi:hypothetical protein
MPARRNRRGLAWSTGSRPCFYPTHYALGSTLAHSAHILSYCLRVPMETIE